MGQPKALLPWTRSGVTLGAHVIETLRDAGLAPLAIVTGAHHDRIAPVFAGTDVLVLYNARHEEGQLASLQAGLRWAFSEHAVDWATVTLVDVPAVRPDTVRLLAGRAASSDSLVIRPEIHGKHGHPVIWRRAAAAMLDTADPTVGGRALVRALAAKGHVLDVPVDDPGVLTDVDTPEEYEALRGKQRL
ncbi:glycosyl transferase [Luteitalea sp. TBR-22]|nr:glycosyl transferase [Luteitalea sp. TBR-22]